MVAQTYSIKSSVFIVGAFISALWVIKSAEILFALNLTYLGIFPGEVSGLIGILTAPLIHGSISHISNNSLSLLILGTALLYGYPKTRWHVIGIIWIVSGIGIWLFARPVYHIGASGLTHGIFFYIFIASILRRDKRSIVMMMIAFFMYGGMVMSIFPREVGISYESHFFGGAVGALCAFIFYKKDPKLTEKDYDWHEDSLQDDNIGDEWELNDSKTHQSSEPNDDDTPVLENTNNKDN